MENAIESGVLKKTKDTILDNEKKKIFKEAIIYEFFHDQIIAVNRAHTDDIKKVVREKIL